MPSSRPNGTEIRATPIDTIPLGSLFIGQDRVFRALLYNNNPLTSSFAIKLIDQSKGDEPADGGAADDEIPCEVTCIPSEGTLEPFAQMELEFKFSPRNPPIVTGFKSQLKTPPSSRKLNLVAQVELTDTGSIINCPVVAVAVEPKLFIAHPSFEFDECQVYERADIVTQLQNKSEDLPVHFAFSKLAQFMVTPPSGRLLPMQTMDVRVSFVPHNLGEFRGFIELTTEGGVARQQLSVHGVSLTYAAPRRYVMGGTDKIPSDFKPVINYVKPKEHDPEKWPKTAGTRALAKTLNPDHQGTTKPLKAWQQDDWYVGPETVESVYTFSKPEFEFKTQIRDTYNDALRVQREHREKKKQEEITMILKYGRCTRVWCLLFVLYFHQHTRDSLVPLASVL